ncbi:MAG: tetratricopeptide repeat protein [Polyangiaceae bacterium]
MSARRALAPLLALVCTAVAQSPPARADAPPAPDAEVVDLYREARALVNQGRWDEACPRFDRAMAKQPTASILINVGDCHAHEGKLARALEDYEVARELNRETREPARRVALASEIDLRLKKLTPRIPKLRIAIASAVTGMVVRCDGEPIDPDKLGADLSLDPGPHLITAEAPGFESDPQRLTLEEATSASVTIRFTPRSFGSLYRTTLVLGATTLALAGAGAALAGWTATAGANGSRDDVTTGTVATGVVFGAAGAAAGATLLVLTLVELPAAPKVQAYLAGPTATLRVIW